MESRRRSEFLGLIDEETPIVELKVGSLMPSESRGLDEG